MPKLDRADIFKDAEQIRQAHLHEYLTTHGKEGHFWDTSRYGGPGPMSTLILKVIGRKSGNARLVPLIYGIWAGEYVIVGSKGGIDEHPYWYLNLLEQRELEFQVGDKAWRGTWREAASERAEIWEYLIRYFPPYADYQANTRRVIPVVLLKPKAAVEPFG
jgi:deazaflavin-dependent oxidoreductase (nitroreductase family)